jgi:hypothetical protein
VLTRSPSSGPASGLCQDPRVVSMNNSSPTDSPLTSRRAVGGKVIRDSRSTQATASRFSRMSRYAVTLDAVACPCSATPHFAPRWMARPMDRWWGKRGGVGLSVDERGGGTYACCGHAVVLNQNAIFGAVGSV